MGRGKKRTSPISATELMAQLEKDEEFQRKRKIREEALSARAAELTAAEQPIVRDLRASGVAVDSVWDLVSTVTPYPAALPVLMHHLEVGGYPDRVIESLGRALAVKPSIEFWTRLKNLYLSSLGAGEREGAAIALAAAAGQEQVDDLMGFLRNPYWGKLASISCPRSCGSGEKLAASSLRALRTIRCSAKRRVCDCLARDDDSFRIRSRG